MRQTVGILGTPIDVLDTEAVLVRMEQFIQERRFHQVATANTDFLINALSDPELRHILRNADLVIPDGMPVVWAARLMRSPLPERVTGADIVPALAALAARKGYRLYMLGARPEIAQRARARLEADYPGLQIVGCVSPPISPVIAMDSEALLEDIARARPDILFVAFGNPKQEKWIHMHRECLRDVPICIGVGGTFDFLAGTPRAPAWMQRRGLEWIHRLYLEPRRLWRRYVRDIAKSRYLVKQWWALRQGHTLGTSCVHSAQVGDCTILSILGDFKATMLPRFQAAAEEAINARTRLILDLQGVTSFDGEALGTLINLPKRAAYRGCDICLVYLPPTIAVALRRSQMHDGLYTIAESMAQAFLVGSRLGLCWRILCGKEAAVVEAKGGADHWTTSELEKVCVRLLEDGKQVDLDARGITYVDSYLLAMLYGLARKYNALGDRARLRIAAGEALYYMLTRENILDKFTLRDAPELPPDAVEQTADALGTPASDTTVSAPSVESMPAYAPRII